MIRKVTPSSAASAMEALTGMLGRGLRVETWSPEPGKVYLRVVGRRGYYEATTVTEALRDAWDDTRTAHAAIFGDDDRKKKEDGT